MRKMLTGRKRLNSELHCIIERSIHKLPESFRLAIVLREFQGLSYEEIAEITKQMSVP